MVIPEISIKNLNLEFGELKIFENFNLSIPSKKTTCILGTSGIGKTSLLFLIAKLLKPTSGKIEYARLNPKIAFVFQDLRLIPWITAIENITYIMGKNINAEKIAREYMKDLGLADFERHYPNELSGGMNRRLCLARAMASDADIFLLDEAFSSLDKKTKLAAIDVFKNYIQQHKKTAICVTHDSEIPPLIADETIQL